MSAEMQCLERDFRKALEAYAPHHPSKEVIETLCRQALDLSLKRRGLKKDDPKSQELGNRIGKIQEEVDTLELSNGYKKAYNDLFSEYVEVEKYVKRLNSAKIYKIEEMDERFNRLRKLEQLEKIWRNVCNNRRVFEGIDEEVLPWAKSSVASCQDESKDVSELYKSKMEKLYASDPEKWQYLKIYYGAYKESRNNKELADQFSLTERTISRQIQAGEEYATNTCGLPPLPCPPHRRKRHGG